ncbi:MAG: PEP-CTERM sorting domain-containing protein [Planctomycetota bacterium]
MKNTMLAGAAVLVAGGSVASAQNLEVLLEVDLTVAGEVTITATDGLSAIDASGSDTTGFYLAEFYTSDLGGALTSTLVAGDLTSANETTDTTPLLFRGTFPGVDTGLNVFSYTDDLSSTFTAGSVAFSGSGTWTVADSDDIADLLGANLSGEIYFPADTGDDITGLAPLGLYTVIVPEPTTAGLLGVVSLGLLRRRRA